MGAESACRLQRMQGSMDMETGLKKTQVKGFQARVAHSSPREALAVRRGPGQAKMVVELRHQKAW